MQGSNQTLRYIIDPGIDDVSFFAINDFIATGRTGTLAIAITAPLWLSTSELVLNGAQVKLDQIAYAKFLYGISDVHNRQQIELMRLLATTFGQTK